MTKEQQIDICPRCEATIATDFESMGCWSVVCSIDCWKVEFQCRLCGVRGISCGIVTGDGELEFLEHIGLDGYTEIKSLHPLAKEVLNAAGD